MNFMLTFLIFGLVCLTVNGKKPAPAKPPAKVLSILNK